MIKKTDKSQKELLPQEKYSLTEGQRQELEKKTSKISTMLISLFFGLIPLIATAAIWIQQSGTKVSKLVSGIVLAVYCIGVAIYIGYAYFSYGRIIAKMASENKRAGLSAEDGEKPTENKDATAENG